MFEFFLANNTMITLIPEHLCNMKNLHRTDYTICGITINEIDLVHKGGFTVRYIWNGERYIYGNGFVLKVDVSTGEMAGERILAFDNAIMSE